VIVFRRDGNCVVTKIQEKGFVGKDIIHVAVFRKGDERMVYNLVYLDGGSGKAMVKRFQVLGVTRDREYDLTKGTKGSKVLYLSANPNGEAEVVSVHLTQGAKARDQGIRF
jgi:topoisomerase IV subunit A